MSSITRSKRSGSVGNSSGGSKRKKYDPGRNDRLTKSGEFGIIESLSLCNFMCHDNLEFQFGPNINFIIGQNGSGKSAILTAIILALGGRSSVTGRYPNIKGFIKTEKHKAKIELVLKNGGSHPYEPQSYGPKITIVREITSDGLSSYKLKSSTGKVVSTSKEDLNNILNAMDIQIENPVSALTQESSRSFLTARKPEKLYQFFYQGTGLEALEKSYNTIQLMKEDAATELKRKKEMLPGMEKELKTWKRILETSAKINDYKLELLWAGVIEIEGRLKESEEELTKAQNELAKFKQKYRDNKEKLGAKTSNLDELHKKKDECDAVMALCRDKLKALKPEKENCAAELRILEGKLSSHIREENRTHQEMLRLEKSINDNLTKNQNDLNEDKRLREKEIERLNQGLEKNEQAMKQWKTERDAKMKLQTDLKAKRDAFKSEINRRKCELNKEGEELDRLKKALKNRVNLFGGSTENILEEIRRQSDKFLKLPRGPIGIYLKVNDPRWTSAVETCITANLLRAYCCDNDKDSCLLKQILKKYYPQYIPSVLISKYIYEVYDISKYKVQSNYPTVLDMLTIQDPVIANLLIDNVHIESKILIEDKDEAVKYMMTPPKYCEGAILMDCSTIALNPYRIYASEKRYRKSLLSSVGMGEIKTLEQRSIKILTEIKGLESELNSLLDQINRVPEEMINLDKKIVECSRISRIISEKIRDLPITEDPKTRHDMEEDLQQLKMEYEKIKVLKQKYELEVKEQKSKIGDVTKEIDTSSGLLKEEGRKYNDLCVSYTNCGHEKEALASAVNQLAMDIKECELKLEPLKKKVEEGCQVVEVAVKAAEQAGPRIDTDRSTEVLGRLLAATELAVEKQSQCNREELQRKYVEKYAKVKEAKRKLSAKEQYVEYIDSMYKLRRKHFQAICLQTQFCINTGFTVYLRDYHAKLVFDTKARTLVLEAQPMKGGAKLKNRGGKCSSLSGGERSFVTIAFLLALWERIKSPFKILDEYDVFMDSNNRKLSIDLLISQAGEMPDSQFIFLSPLDLPQIEESSLIKIHQMPAPQRVEPVL